MITVGRLVARKAVDQLVKMVSRLDNKKLNLLIIGSGPQENSLKQLARELNIESRIHFLGHTSEEDKFEILRMADIYVSTSQHEGFGIVYLEAMACGLPVVCYDFGGQTDFLSNDKTGYVIKLNDFDEFVSRCKRLISNPGIRKSIGEHNTKSVEDYYIERCAERYECVFEQAIVTRSNRKTNGYTSRA
jgi:glycosyltransferase involved in cell wall biosynthesis